LREQTILVHAIAGNVVFVVGHDGRGHNASVTKFYKLGDF
jgi:hypothetical protein